MRLMTVITMARRIVPVTGCPFLRSGILPAPLPLVTAPASPHRFW
jgi:hypothetical protein